MKHGRDTNVDFEMYFYTMTKLYCVNLNIGLVSKYQKYFRRPHKFCAAENIPTKCTSYNFTISLI